MIDDPNRTQLNVALPDATATARLGRRLSKRLSAGDVICLVGGLGAGKTTLARGLIDELTGVKNAPSPTFSLVETYTTPDFDLWHFDLYRLDKPGDVWELGLEEALSDGACIIEWPESIAVFLPDDALLITIETTDNVRTAKVSAPTRWLTRLEAIGIE